MQYYNMEFGFPDRPPYLKDYVGEVKTGPQWTAADFPAENIVAPGLDYDAWNGAMLIGRRGTLFAVRMDYAYSGVLYSGKTFYDGVKISGDYAGNSAYAQVETDHLRLTWAKADKITLVCCAEAKQSLLLQPTAYIPHHFPGQIQTENGKIIGTGPEIATVLGSKQITGGHIIRKGAYRVTMDRQAPEKMEFYCCGRPLDGAVSAFSMKAGEKCFFAVGITDGTHMLPDWTAEECEAVIEREKAAYLENRVYGTGSWGEGLQIVANGMRWLKTYFPLEKAVLLPAGRPWMGGGYFNIWGWDEAINGYLASLGGNAEETKSQFLNTIGDERLGVLSAFGGMTRFDDPDSEKKLYEAYRNVIELNPAMVRGEEGNHNVGKGMDDTPMREEWRGMGEMYSLDMSCMKCWSLEILAGWAAKYDTPEEAERLASIHRQMQRNLHETFWNEEQQLYMNRYLDGSWTITRSPTSFYPLLAGVPDRETAQKLVHSLLDEKRFWGKYVIPSLSRDDPEYGKTSRVPNHMFDGDKYYPAYCYWRGTIWAPTNFLVYLGLSRYHFNEVACEFAQKSLNLWRKSYDTRGWTCENYDPETGEKGFISTTQQSWGYLLPAMAATELLDAELWTPDALRFSGYSLGDNAVYHIPVHGKHYSRVTLNGITEVTCENTPVFRCNAGKFFVRDFSLNRTDFLWSSPERAKLTVWDKGMARSAELEPGKYRISAEHNALKAELLP